VQLSPPEGIRQLILFSYRVHNWSDADVAQLIASTLFAAKIGPSLEELRLSSEVTRFHPTLLRAVLQASGDRLRVLQCDFNLLKGAMLEVNRPPYRRLEAHNTKGKHLCLLMFF